MSKKPEWISEAEACKIIGYKPIVLRRKVKSGKLDIDYHTFNGRLYQYDKKDIEKEMLKHSSVLA